ncbi:4Fe-4S dicluster domain-containing protein [Microbispora sp. SCL1-1]|uniref:4Fe-4S binding protein n=1 Tax=unclassified Microbispora TaxID=2614687 RepID=UPI00115758FA|nr:4Fe-4S binding protein [Microbispora sp. SCL1-1]NJP26058.1 4Fe-4S binding protein [Microbispora sp. CL1-1]TQS12828.1 4Fe-4S dicluster domain-containing protein [Microbispora sp. SCL1-1]
MAALAYLVTEACAGCGACLLTCPEHAIRPSGRPGDRPDSRPGASLVVLDSRCTRCGECAEVCPVDAVLEVRA